MTMTSRRAVVLAGGALLTVAACDSVSNPVSSDGPTIDARADAALDFLETTYPDTVNLREQSTGMLIMPLITEAGLWVGGAYGEGVLRINNATVDYYSAAQASVGLQIGAQQYSHVLYFMSEEALSDFRNTSGWTAGVSATYATIDGDGDTVMADTNTLTSPVVALIFGQAGLVLGATIDGTKYTRISR